MKRGIAYIMSLLITSIILYQLVTGILYTNLPTVSFFVSIIVSYLIIQKNQWIIDSFMKLFRWLWRI